MKCPECKSKCEVVNSRHKDYGRYRRYECEQGHRFTTVEVALEEGEPTVLVSYALGLVRGRISAQELGVAYPTHPAPETAQ